MGHPDVGSLPYWGGICCGFAALVLGGMMVGEVRRARNTLRRVTANGRVTHASETTDKYGAVSGKVIQVAFTSANGAHIKFTEDVDERHYASGQDVTVHYDPRQPIDTATVTTKRAAFGRTFAFAAAVIVLLVIFIGNVFLI